MRKIVLMMLMLVVGTSLMAWDCKGYIHQDNQISDESYCRRVVALESIVVYDKVSIKVGSRITYDKSVMEGVIKALTTEVDTCYDTCMMANKKF